jgi:hypothetical protein
MLGGMVTVLYDPLSKRLTGRFGRLRPGRHILVQNADAAFLGSAGEAGLVTVSMAADAKGDTARWCVSRLFRLTSRGRTRNGGINENIEGQA